MRFHLGTTMLVAFALACAPAPEEPEGAAKALSTAEHVAAINTLRDEYVAAENGGDSATLVTLWTDDGVLMPAHAPAANGKEAIQGFYQARFEQFTQELTVSSEELQVADQWAFDRGTYALTLSPKAGGEGTEDNGKYIVIVQRQPDGSWKFARLIWNSDNPPPGMGQ